MAFKAKSGKTGKEYFLHSHPAANGKSSLYFFSLSETGGISEIPEGYVVIESEKTGMPMLKKRAS